MMVGIETIPCTDCGNALGDEEAVHFIRNNFAGQGTPLCEPCKNQRAIFHLRNQTLRDAAPVKPTDEHGFSDEERAHLEENLGHRPQFNPHNIDEAWQNKLAGEPMDIAWQLLKGKKPDPRLKAAGVSGYNKPKRTPNHPKKSHIVVARSGGKTKTIRFGQKGAKTVTEDNPKGKRAKKQDSFKARHAKNIKRGPMSAAYWANKVKW